MSTEVDVAVVGLGPGGEAVAGALAKAGLDVIGVDMHLVGGECPYYGCVPTKMMVRAADLLEAGRLIPGMAGTSTVVADWTPVAERITTEATTGWNDQIAADRLTDAGGRLVRGHARLTGERTLQIGDETFVTRRGIVLNTGTRPAVPPIPGLSETPFWTNRDIVKVEQLPGSLLVIGGGAIGVELAQVFARFGVDVTVLEVGERLMSVEEPESGHLLMDTFANEGIQVLTDVEISEVAYSDGHFSVNVGEQTLTADKLLVAAGRRPNLDDIGLETVGLDPTVRALDPDEHMRVADGLWAIGDITGKGAFTHVSMYQSAIAIASVLDERDAPEAEYRAVPRVTFTDPEIGSVGMSERQARAAGLNVRVGFTDIAASTRGWINKVDNAGFIKLIEDADAGVLVGATVAAPNGGEILSALTVAVHGKVATKTLKGMIYAYPTLHRALEVAVNQLR